MGGLRAFSMETGSALRSDYKQSAELVVTVPVTKSTLQAGLEVQGHTLAEGESVLLTAQTDASENGLWTIKTGTAPIRRSDADSGIKLNAGATIPITAGDGINTEWVLTTTGPIEVGTTALSFTEHKVTAASVTGLGTAATKDVGTTAGTVAAGDALKSHTDATTGAHGGIEPAGAVAAHANLGAANAHGGVDPAGSAATVQGNLNTHTGLTTTAHGGIEPAGAVSTHNGLGTGAHGGIVASNDSRLSDARTPTAHASSHSTGQGDAISVTNIGGVASNDARLSDARTPTAHASSHSTGQSDAISPANIGAASASDLSNHTGATTGAHGGIVASNDSRLSDARTPTAHTHGSFTGQQEWCQGLFYNTNDGNALYKRAWRISVENGIVTNIENLGAYKINAEAP